MKQQRHGRDFGEQKGDGYQHPSDNAHDGGRDKLSKRFEQLNHE